MMDSERGERGRRKEAEGARAGAPCCGGRGPAREARQGRRRMPWLPEAMKGAAGRDRPGVGASGR